MTEVVIGADTGNKRRLPPWMLLVNAADAVRKSANRGAKVEKMSEASRPKNPVIKNHPRTLIEDVDAIHQSDSLPRCEARRRTKKEKRSDEGPITSFPACIEAKGKPKRKDVGYRTAVNERTITQKQRMKSKRTKNSDVSDMEEVSPERSDDKISLTVEDLMSFAKEHVSADEETKSKYQSARECQSETDPSSLSISSKAITRETAQAGEFSQMLSKCTSSYLNEKEGKERENHRSENFAINFVSTGDTAQDMLNLYLGPFLKKSALIDQSVQQRDLSGLLSVPSVQTNESSESLPVLTMKSKGVPGFRTIDHESEGLQSGKAFESKGSPSIRVLDSGLPSLCEFSNQSGSCAFSKEEANLMKKKSSLKEKVAMLFDSHT